MNGQTLAKAFVPLPGGATAVYAGTSLSYYRHAEWLGSSRFASTTTRTMRYDGAYAPYGENYAETGITDRSFTGQNQDTISSGSYPLYDFMFREHHPVHGRWLSPDPVAGDVMNPQSLNRYAYVLNDPVNFTDPLGLRRYIEDPFEGGGWGGWGGYYVDGMPVSSSQFGALMGMGAAVVCPFGDCTGIRAVQGPGGSTVFERWVPAYYLPPDYGVNPDTGAIQVTTNYVAGHWETVGTVRDTDDWTPIKTLSKGLNALGTPLQNAAVGAGLIQTGAALIVGSIALAPAVCAAGGPLGCIAYGIGAVPTVGGGVVLIGTGYQWTRQVTIPSFVNLYKRIFGR